MLRKPTRSEVLQVKDKQFYFQNQFLKTMKKMQASTIRKEFMKNYKSFLWLLLPAILFYGCERATSKSNTSQDPLIPVISLVTKPAVTYREYSTSLEGSKDVEIRPQVTGYLEKIYVDEGAHVKSGQPLFRIDDAPYREELKNAQANLLVAKAKLESAEINLTKLTPLVENHVVSDVQLKAAQATRDAAKASVQQAEAVVSNAQINLGYTLIKAPADGYLGRIPFKKGSLVEKNAPEALTVLSAVDHIYAYFSMSETDFLKFKHQYSGNTIEDKIRQLPPVELIMADDSIYPQKGRVETVLGQFDKTMGTISFRAIFPNESGLLRSGNTGKIKIPHPVTGCVIVPRASTFELQDKIFVFALGKGNKVSGTPITIAAESGHYYLVSKGIQPGDKIIYTGLERLREGVVIQPHHISLDSLLQADPL
jgi:membrane fusion protein (multidrug efflux system)